MDRLEDLRDPLPPLERGLLRGPGREGRRGDEAVLQRVVLEEEPDGALDVQPLELLVLPRLHEARLLARGFLDAQEEHELLPQHGLPLRRRRRPRAQRQRAERRRGLQRRAAADERASPKDTSE